MSLDKPHPAAGPRPNRRPVSPRFRPSTTRRLLPHRFPRSAQSNDSPQPRRHRAEARYQRMTARILECNKARTTTINDGPRFEPCTSSGAKGIRTPDLFHAMEARYQLRHSPVFICRPRCGDPLSIAGATPIRKIEGLCWSPHIRFAAPPRRASGAAHPLTLRARPRDTRHCARSNAMPEPRTRPSLPRPRRPAPTNGSCPGPAEHRSSEDSSP